MSKRIFTKLEIEQLLQNPNIESCSEKSITYKKEFKIFAVKEWKKGTSPRDIFRGAGFNLSLIGHKKPKWCLGDWRRIFKEKGEGGLKADDRGKGGGRPKGINHLSDKEKLKYLEAQVAYLKAENGFLAKLRKKS